MTIGDLFKTRQSIYYKNLTKYLKYVLNDHFVILLLVLGGATGLAYQNYLESVQPGALIPRMILGLVVLLVIFSGSIRTLVEPADAVFLLPKEKSFSNIMKKNLLYSLIFHGFFTVLAGFLSAPLLTAVNHMGPEEQIFWMMSLLLWKITHGILTYHQLKQQRTEIIWTIRMLIRLITVTGLAFSLFLSVMIGFFSALLATVVFSVYVFIYSQNDNWNWESLIETEQKRTQKIYSIINMFIETPYSKHKVKRLKFLDFFYKLPVLNQNVEIYYLSRMFIRNYNFSGLYLRLLTIGSIAIYFSTNWMIESVLSILFLYLIGFQLVPLRQTFKKSVYFRLYPDTDTDKIKTIQKLLLLLLAISGFIFSMAAVSSGWTAMLTLLVVNGVFIWLFIYGYLARRLSK